MMDEEYYRVWVVLEDTVHVPKSVFDGLTTEEDIHEALHRYISKNYPHVNCIEGWDWFDVPPYLTGEPDDTTKT